MRKLLLTLSAIFLLLISAISQKRNITGTVTDDKGIPVANATVQLKGTSTGTITATDGTYSLPVSANTGSIVFSGINLEPKEESIADRATINVSLTITANALTEVVILGYQTVRRKEVTGSVASVNGKELAQKPIGNFTQLLQGKATGVQVTGQSGRPGANGYIRVRGAGSINASSEPLIVLDGIPITSAAYSLINPNDIEDLVVLKDAASQAIYGSRAANGVIIVSSKKGRGKPTLRYSFQYGKTKALDLQNIHLMNGREKLQYEYEGQITNPILDSMISNRVSSGVFPAGSTLFTISPSQRSDLWNLTLSRAPKNWGDILLPEGRLRTHEVAVSGSDDKFNYYFSLNSSKTDGVSYGSYWNKTGGRLNAEYKALDWFKIGVNLGVTESKENNVRSLYNAQAAYTSLFIINPYEPVYLNDGTTYNVTHAGYSPLEGTDNNPSVLDRIATFTTMYAEANFFKHLTFKTQIGINYNTLSTESYLQPNSNLANILGYNQKTDGGTRDFLYVITNTAIWKQTIAEKHSITLLAGQEYTKDRYYSYTLAARGLPTSSVNTQDNAGRAQTATTSRYDWALLSYFANVTYDYKKKYYLNVTGRRDGSSRFGANKRFANFWAVGGAWDVTNENFFKSKAINTLKFRGSIGTAGTVPGIAGIAGSGNYENLGVYSLTAKYDDLPAAVPARLPNADLTWETNKNYDFGLDFGFFGNRLSGTADYYKRKTNDLIYPKNVSYTTGFTSFTSNIGNLENKGYEFSLNGDLIRGKDLIVNLFASYSHNDNKFLKLYSNNSPQNLSYFTEGQPAYTYFLNRWAGINPSNGKNLFYTVDGNLTETYSSSDAVLLKGKSPNVKWFGSFGTYITYKGLDLNAQFYYSGGNYIMNYIWQTGASEGENINDAQLTDAFSYWKKPGDITRYANLNDLAQRKTFDTDKWLEKGDYINLRDVTIGYTTPQSIASKIKLKSLRFYVQGTNLWIGTKFHGLPEVGEPNGETGLTSPGLYNLFAQPQLRAVTFGVDVKF